MKSRLALVFIVCLLGVNCEEQSEAHPSAHAELADGAPEASKTEAVAQAEPEEQAELEPASPAAQVPRGTAVYQDLLALAHLADVYAPSGLFIDFGTAAR